MRKKLCRFWFDFPKCNCVSGGGENLNIMRKLFLFSLVIFFTIFFIGLSCSKNESNIAQEIISENNLKSVVFESSFNEVIGSVDNLFNQDGIEYFIKMENLVFLISNSNFDNLDSVFSYIHTEFNSNYSLKEAETDIIVNFFKDAEFNLDNVFILESYILNNYPDNMSLMYNISILKYSLYFAQEKPNSPAFEYCMRNCLMIELGDIFERGNAVKQFFFIAGMPESYLQILASCTWDCL
jgi:hypothetical protein